MIEFKQNALSKMEVHLAQRLNVVENEIRNQILELNTRSIF